MQLKEIYQPVKDELAEVEQVLNGRLKDCGHRPILEMNEYLLESKGKRTRPALVLLSAKASKESFSSCDKLINIAAAIELIHMASLVHDDVIDHSKLRHNKPTINSKKGEDAAIALGDYLYSVAFELISTCDNMDVLNCISSATKAMCEGELLQICERDNVNLSKENYMVIVKKKTAALFASSCQVGSLISNSLESFQKALGEYGLNIGISFQIIDDYLDFVGREEKLGKTPGLDIMAGEITLPVLNLWESSPQKERRELEILIAAGKNKEAFKEIRSKLLQSQASSKTKEIVASFINLAREKIDILPQSPYRQSLFNLAGFIFERGFK